MCLWAWPVLKSTSTAPRRAAGDQTQALPPWRRSCCCRQQAVRTLLLISHVQQDLSSDLSTSFRVVGRCRLRGTVPSWSELLRNISMPDWHGDMRIHDSNPVQSSPKVPFFRQSSSLRLPNALLPSTPSPACDPHICCNIQGAESGSVRLLLFLTHLPCSQRCMGTISKAPDILMWPSKGMLNAACLFFLYSEVSR